MDLSNKISQYARYILRNAYLLIREMITNIPRSLISGFGIIFLISFLVLSISLRESVKDYLENRIFGKLSINQIKITPVNKTKYISFNLLSGSKNEISRSKIKDISRIKEIENIEKVIRLNFPASLRGGMFGRYMRTDIFISGVDRTFFRGTKIRWKDFVDSEPLPIVIPNFAMDLYNNFAVASGLPQLGERALKRFSVELILGRSSFNRTRKNIFKYNAKLFGLSSKVTTAGVIVPSDFIRKFCIAHKDDPGLQRSPYSCIMIFASVKRIKELPAISKKIKDMGLMVESQMDIASKTDKATSFIDWILALVMITILILTIIAIFNSYLSIIYYRGHSISIQRILGASKLRIVLTVIFEAAIMGAIYGLLGYLLGSVLLDLLSENISQWIPILKGFDLKLGIENLLVLSVTVSMLVSSLSALIPAIFAANSNLFRAIK
ncbi:MAG: FtsX-like permease family protein [Spirochaetota bacterium]|nr:FtsX-like permease family protein [Spirochaetota bacterium]